MTKPDVSVDILLATFNGGEYITRQLNSILSQSYVRWRLLVHDDGSTDNTLDIIRSFTARDPRIVLYEDGVKHLGPAQNFLHLLACSDAELIMFCDQDDIWLEQKVEQLVRTIEHEVEPAMAYCNAYAYKNEKIVPGKVVVFHPVHLRQALFLNGGIHGCTMIINKPLREKILPAPDKVEMHDHLIILAALTFGKLIYLDSVLVYYRQHHKNVTGKYETHPVRRVFGFLNRTKSVVNSRHYLAVKAFFDKFKEEMSDSQVDIFRYYFKYCESRSLLSRLIIVVRKRFSLGNSTGLLLLKTIIRKPI